MFNGSAGARVVRIRIHTHFDISTCFSHVFEAAVATLSPPQQQVLFRAHEDFIDSHTELKELISPIPFAY